MENWQKPGDSRCIFILHSSREPIHGFCFCCCRQWRQNICKRCDGGRIERLTETIGGKNRGSKQCNYDLYRTYGWSVVGRGSFVLPPQCVRLFRQKGFVYAELTKRHPNNRFETESDTFSDREKVSTLSLSRRSLFLVNNRQEKKLPIIDLFFVS